MDWWCRQTRRALFLLSLALLAASAWAQEGKTFTQQQLDQLLAPIALYPDSLLSQALMACTYPADVAEAARWSKANPNLKGDEAVKAVADKPWDPSVQSLAAFPQALAMMGDKPDWVQQVGDAFLAQPDQVMDTVQGLRKRAQEQGNLKSNEQQKVIIEEPAPQQTIVKIEPADPQVVYVPAYNPTVVYGPWWWPAYPPPFYWPPPPLYGFGAGLATGIGFGVGVAITNSLWGGFNWGGHDVDINVNRYNNINVNRQLNVNQNNVSWKHDPAHRRGVPYRDAQTREKFGKQVAGADQRKEFRGKDIERDASRERAQSTLKDRGLDPAKGREKLRNDPQTRERAQAAAGKVDRDRATTARQNAGPDKARATAQKVDRGKAQEAAKGRSRDSAFKNAGSATQARQQTNRGNASVKAMHSRPQAQHSGGARRSGGAAHGGGRRAR